MPQLSFESKLFSDQGAHFIPVPAEAVAALGGGKRVPVKVTINGHTYQTTVAVYGGRYFVGVRREVREAARVTAGDQLTVGLEFDADLRTVDLPADLKAALERDPQALAAFEALSYTDKKEAVAWVTEAKRPTTRERRLARALTAVGSRRRRRA